MLKNTLIIILLLSNLFAFAQKEIGNEKPEVKVIASVNNKKIYLRWGVTTPTAWKYANEYGYILERKTIVRNGVVLDNPEVKKLTSGSIKPKPMMQWKEFTQKNVNAAIAAQALYGDNFDVEMNEGGNGIINILNQAQVLEQRFMFALYAADQDFEVAKFSGLGFVDSSVKPNERYLYNVKVITPAGKLKIAKGGVYLGLSDEKPLPKPLEFVGVFKDKAAILTWNFAILKKYYTNYIIEKSEDNGKTFKSVTDRPIVNLGEREKNPSSRMMYVDSLFQNNKAYQYRIRGISPFGLKGPYSNVVSGKGVTPLIYNPFITKTTFLKDGNVLLNWEFPNEGKNTVSSFQLLRADKARGNYIVIQNISKHKRSIKLSDIRAINYYKIVAVGTDGTKRESFPKMVQPDDNTPPAVPSVLKGTIDSLGVVNISWKANTELDFLGYRVFRANLKDDEFTQITFNPIAQNRIIDTINIKTLNKKIYYKVQALDKRYNPSEFSHVLELKRPDIVPPSPPVFSSFNINNRKVELEWITSSSNDAKSTMLYRKELGKQQSWRLIKKLDLPLNKYTDSTGIVGKTYLYTILTVDDSGLESEPITPLKISIKDNIVKNAISKFSGTVNRELRQIVLTWKVASNAQEFILYRGESGKAPTMYKVFSKEKRKFIDKELLVNTKYKYLLVAVFPSGVKSKIKKIELNY